MHTRGEIYMHVCMYHLWYVYIVCYDLLDCPPVFVSLGNQDK